MSDLIRRSDAIKAVNKAKAEGMTECPTYYLGIVPTIEPKRGKWIWSPRDTDGTVSGCCSNCSFSHLFIGGHTAQYNFCPNCGASMREREGE